MQHEMRLDKGPFERMNSGVKKVEFRINDEKRQQVKVGDKMCSSLRSQNILVSGIVTQVLMLFFV